MGSLPVLHLRCAVERAGPDSVLLDLIPALNRMGHRCDVGVISHVLHPDADLLHALTRRGVRASRLPTHGPVDPRLLLGLVRRSRGHGAIHAHDPKGHVYGAAVAAMTGVPLIATHHGWLSRDPRERFYEGMDARVLRRAHRVVCVSRGGLAELRDARGVPADRLVWIPNGVDTDRLLPIERAAVSERFGVDPGHRLIVAAGRLEPAKGFDVLVRALVRFGASAERPVTALVLGEGPQRARLEGLASRCPAGVRVVLPGYVPDAAAVLGAGDLFVLPSRSEHHPVALLEAMGHGVAVVASDVGDVAETVGEGGAVVTPGDEREMTAVLARLLDDPAARRAHGARGRERVAELFTARRMAEGYARLYATLS
jgi:glycosyltransferase involved in cell wall biosynthesis